MDSTTVATGLATLLDHYLPGLDPRTRLLVIGTLASLIISGLRRALNFFSGYDARIIGAVQPFWEKWSGLLNPLLGALLGYLLDGGNLAGLLAGAAGRGIVKAATSVVSTSASAAGLKKARAAALLLVAGLAVATVAGATEAKKPSVLQTAVARTALSFGPEVRFREDRKPDVAVKIQPALIWGDHLSLRPWVSRSVVKESGNKWETGAFLAIVF